MDTCTHEFERMAAKVGGIDCHHAGLVSFRNPFALDNGTMPVIELLLIVGTAAGLVHAVRWRRRTGDSTNLVVWCAGVVGLLLIEPLAYFPQWFGMEHRMGLAFIHNQFSVQLLFNRLPLYIVAMYPFYAYLAFVLVRRSGVFARFNTAVGAVCVAVTFFCLYEVVDMVGPQLTWWLWNYHAPPGLPRFGAVPLVDLTAFNLAIPFGIAFVARLVSTRRWNVPTKVLVTSVGMLPFLTIASMPTNVLNWVGLSTHDARTIGTWLVIAAAFAVAAVAFTRSSPVHDGDPFVAIWVGVYLLVVAGIWAYALPDYFGAKNGVTAAGTQTSPFGFALLCAALCIGLVGVAYRRPIRRTVVVAHPEPA